MKKILPLLLLAWAGCAGVPRPEPAPDGFVPVDEGRYDWRYMSAAGVMLAGRSFAREPEGTLDFWASVLQKDLETRRGYLLQSSEPLQAGSAAGRSMLFAAGGADGGLYLVSIFLTPKRIVSIEAGGPREQMEKELPKLKAAVATIRLN